MGGRGDGELLEGRRKLLGFGADGGQQVRCEDLLADGPPVPKSMGFPEN